MRRVFIPASPPIKQHFSINEAIGIAVEATSLIIFGTGFIGLCLFLVPVPQ